MKESLLWMDGPIEVKHSCATRQKRKIGLAPLVPVCFPK